jgi:PST family polysaccharide transporter
VARPATEILLLGSMVVLARLISPAEFGRYAVALVVQELAFNIPSEGIGSALIQRRELTREHLQAGMAMALLAGIGLVGLTLIVSPLAIRPIFGARTALFVELVTPLCMLSAVSAVPVAIMCRNMAFRRLGAMEVSSTLVRVCVCIGLAIIGLNGESLIFGTLVGAFVATAMALVSARPPMPRLHIKAARELLEYGLPASLATVTWAGFRNCDYAIVGARLGAVSAGMYFRSYTLAIEYQKKVSGVMNSVGFPVLSRTHSSAQMADIRRQMIRVILALVAPELVPFLFGARWHAAVVPTQILAIGGASTLVMDAIGTVLMASGRTRALFGFGLAHWLVYGTTVFLVVQLGIVAVAIDAAVIHTTFLFVAYAVMLRDSEESPLRCLWADIAPAVVSCLGLAVVTVPASLALSSANLPRIVQLTAVALIAAPPYLLTLRVCFSETWVDLSTIIGQVLPKRSRRVPTPLIQGSPEAA